MILLTVRSRLYFVVHTLLALATGLVTAAKQVTVQVLLLRV